MAPDERAGDEDHRRMSTDAELYLRGTETLLASWEEYARGATGAAV